MYRCLRCIQVWVICLVLLSSMSLFAEGSKGKLRDFNSRTLSRAKGVLSFVGGPGTILQMGQRLPRLGRYENGYQVYKRGLNIKGEGDILDSKISHLLAFATVYGLSDKIDVSLQVPVFFDRRSSDVGYIRHVPLTLAYGLDLGAQYTGFRLTLYVPTHNESRMAINLGLPLLFSLGSFRFECGLFVNAILDDVGETGLIIPLRVANSFTRSFFVGIETGFSGLEFGELGRAGRFNEFINLGAFTGYTVFLNEDKRIVEFTASFIFDNFLALDVPNDGTQVSDASWIQTAMWRLSLGLSLSHDLSN